VIHISYYIKDHCTRPS